MNQDDNNQNVLDGLSRNVTALCQAIDPTAQHGPETEKIVAWENEIRADLKLLLLNLYDAAFVGDEQYSEQVLRLVRKLGWEREIQDRLWPKRRQFK